MRVDLYGPHSWNRGKISSEPVTEALSERKHIALVITSTSFRIASEASVFGLSYNKVWRGPRLSLHSHSK